MDNNFEIPPLDKILFDELDFSWWTRDIARNLAIRYHSQSGSIEDERWQEYMRPRYLLILQKLGKDLEDIHNRAFKLRK